MRIITVARKPLSEGTVAGNVLRWGTGGINIDGCRIGILQGESFSTPQSDPTLRQGTVGTDLGITRATKDRFQQAQIESIERTAQLGRYPANLILQHSSDCVSSNTEVSRCTENCPVAELDRQSGLVSVGVESKQNNKALSLETEFLFPWGSPDEFIETLGGVSRYFKQMKA